MRRRGWLPLLGAALVTLGASWFYAAVGAAAPQPPAAGSWAVVLLLPLPLAVSALWGWSMLTTRHPLLPPAVAVAVVAAGLGLAGGPIALQVATSAAAGLLAGRALAVGWRLDAALALCALALVPAIVMALAEVPPAEQLQGLRAQMETVLQGNLPQGAEPRQRELALAAEMQRLDRVLDLAGRIYPLLLAIGLLAQAALVLLAVRLLARVGGGAVTGWRFGTFARLRLPFYLVWGLVAGLGLLVTRSAPLAPVGLNLALLAALILSVQGLAVQVFVVGRLLSPVGRLLFWSMMGIFFAPLVIVSGALLGLADQWLDFRGLERMHGDDHRKDDDQKAV